MQWARARPPCGDGGVEPPVGRMKGDARAQHALLGQTEAYRCRRRVVTKHLLALRWMNPTALVYLRDSPEAGESHVEFELWNGRRSGFGVSKSDNPEKLVAKLMFAARDLGLDGADVRAVLDGSSDYVVPEPEGDGEVWHPRGGGGRDGTGAAEDDGQSHSAHAAAATASALAPEEARS